MTFHPKFNFWDILYVNKMSIQYRSVEQLATKTLLCHMQSESFNNLVRQVLPKQIDSDLYCDILYYECMHVWSFIVRNSTFYVASEWTYYIIILYYVIRWIRPSHAVHNNTLCLKKLNWIDLHSQSLSMLYFILRHNIKTHYFSLDDKIC